MRTHVNVVRAASRDYVHGLERNASEAAIDEHGSNSRIGGVIAGPARI